MKTREILIVWAGCLLRLLPDLDLIPMPLDGRSTNPAATSRLDRARLNSAYASATRL